MSWRDCWRSQPITSNGASRRPPNNNTLTFFEQIDAAARFVARRARVRPKLVVILGSGLGAAARIVRDAVWFSYSELPYFPVTSVRGHRGQLLTGALAGMPTAVFEGRFHLYEGLSFRQVALPVYLARRLGGKTLIITNAAGGINPKFAAGDIMLVRDHLNLMGGNPLTGEHDPKFGRRFPSMCGAYDANLLAAAHAAAKKSGVRIRQGVYAGVRGPAYETAAEGRMLAKLGADAVGMSTVPEVIAARQCGMRVLGISVIANVARYGRDKPDRYIDLHSEVLRVAQKSAPAVREIIEAVAAYLAGR